MIAQPAENATRAPLPILWRVAAAALILLVLAACGQAESEGQALARARDALDAGDYATAAIHLKSTLSANARNAEARWLLGRVHLAVFDIDAAIKELERAQEYGWPREEVVVPLARAYLLDDPERVLRYAAILVSDEPGFSAETRAELHLIRAIALVQTGKRAGARSEVERAVEIAPDAAPTLLARALLAYQEQAWDEARSYLDRAIAIAPQRAELYSTRGDVAIAQQRFDDALIDYRKASKLWPAHLAFRLALVDLLVRAGDLDAAEAALKIALAAAPDSAPARYLEALIAYQRGDYKAAAEGADRALANAPGNAPALFLAGASTYALGLYERSNQYLAKAGSTFGANKIFKRLYTAVQLQVGEVDAALKSMPDPNGTLEPEDIRFMEAVGMQIAGRGHPERAESLLAAAAEADPDRVSTLLSLARTRIRNDAWAESIAPLQRALELDPDLPQAEVLVVLAALHEKRVDEAREQAQRLRDKYPTKAWPAVLLGLIEAERGELTAAKASFRNALEIDPGHPDAASNLGLVLQAEGKLEEARDAFELALEKRPGDLNLLEKLAVIEARLKNPAKAVEHLEKAIAANPDAERPRTILASAYLMSARPADALRVSKDFAQGRVIGPKLLEVLANASYQLEDYAAATGYFERLLEAKGESAEIQRILAVSAFRSGNNAKAMRAAQRAVDLDSADDQSRLLLARVHAAEGRLSEAKSIVRALLEANPDSTTLLNVDGTLAVAEKRYNDAVDAFRRAYALAPTSEFARRLALALFNAGRITEAETLLTERLQQTPGDGETRFLLANHHLNANNLEPAQREFAILVEQYPDQPLVRNNLAWLLMQAGKPNEALPHAERAYELDKDNPQVLDTLALIHLDLGDKQRALVLLQQASSAAPNDKNIATNLAHTLVANGRRREAKTLLSRLLESSETFSARESAVLLLQELDAN